MFNLEKEMIPVLIDELSSMYNTNSFVKEFNTGNGIADLVFTTKINNESIVLNSYALMSTFIQYFHNKKKISISNVNKIPQLRKLFKYLEDNDLVHVNNDYVQLNKPYQPHTKDLISIEAKLKDWRSGFYQALRYQFFSQKSFLAISSEYVHRVDINTLKLSNIGLISVSKNGIEIIFNPKNKNIIDDVSYYYLSELFVSKLDLCT